MKHYITSLNEYYVGDVKLHESDTEVLARPSHLHDWDGNNWILNTAKQDKQLRLQTDSDELLQDKLDSQLIAFLNMTGDEINNAVNAAFTDPAQRVVIKRLAKFCQHTARRLFRDGN